VLKTWASRARASERRSLSESLILSSVILFALDVDWTSDLDQLTDDFPEDFFKMKVLPELLKSVEFGGGGPKAFSVVMKIATKLSNDDFDSKVTPVVVRLFGNPDRAIRVCLLDSLPLMIDRLSQKVVNDKIFPQIVS
jgi:SCY1-like protein 1